MTMKTLHTLVIAAGMVGLGAGAIAAPAACTAHSAAKVPTLVELYTSEGCSSCPPADRWLSTLKGRDDVLTLAFHVNYWDRLGWVDRFASPEATARQHELARWMGNTSVFTPQVVVNGRDASAGARLPERSSESPLSINLQREGEHVVAQVAPSSAGPARLDGYWAVVEDAHQSQVRAGENAGETLKHDSVVRLYRPVAAWSSAQGQRAQIDVGPGVESHPRRVVFVVTDAATHRPLQAVALGC